MSEQNAWQKWGWGWSAIFMLSILVPLLTVWLSPSLAAEANVPLVSALSIGLMGWHVLFIRWFVRWEVPQDTQLPTRFLYIWVAIGFWFALVSQLQLFNFILFGLFGQIYGVLVFRYAIPHSIVLTLLVVERSTPDMRMMLDPRDFGFWYLALGILMSSFFAYWIGAIITQSAQRKALIAELEQTRVELAASEREAGRLAERERLAREIHDTLAQGFTSIVMHLEATEQALAQNQASANQHVGMAKEMAREGLAQARRVVQDLRPEVLEKEPLPQAIKRVATQWAQRTGLHLTTTTTGTSQPLNPEAEVTLLRATQEALMNVQKHAQAREVTITLSYLGDVVVLDVQDDGIGMKDDGIGMKDDGPGDAIARFVPPSSQNGTNFGLQAMHQRVNAQGGNLLIESEPNEGTTLVIELPIQQ